MARVFDVALIGAGPAAYAALLGLRGTGRSLMVITGASAEIKSAMHAKIQSVSFERRRPPSLADLCQSVDGQPTVFASAEVGGLANYWGQQLQTYGEGDPWGAGGTISTSADYLALCDEIEAGFVLSGGCAVGAVSFSTPMIELETPRLLVGTKAAPDAGLDAMSYAVQERLAEVPHHRSDARVQRMVPMGEFVQIFLSDGTDAKARGVLLAAGVVGTSSILARSLSVAMFTEFRDHAPLLVQTYGLMRALGYPKLGEIRHLNALALLSKCTGACNMFASVYQMSQAPISLITASLRLGTWLRGLRLGPLADAIRPMQIWTDGTLTSCRHFPREGSIEAVPMDFFEDEKVNTFITNLRRRGVRASLKGTPAGQGFHYHALCVAQEGCAPQPVDHVLQDVFSGRVRCIDSSILPKIGCQPHTLTAMAEALARTRIFIENSDLF